MKSLKYSLSALLLLAFVAVSATSCKTKEKCAAYSSISKPNKQVN